jgi:RimJ/RimL family protein N-acetyltransferase
MNLAVSLPSSSRPHFIETDRLVLSRPHPADAERIASLCNDRALAENMTVMPHPYTTDDAREWLETVRSRDEDALVYGIHLNIPERVLIGVISVERKAPDQDPELGYWLGQGYRGRGFTTEAARAILRQAFQSGRYAAVASSCRLTNIPSRRILEKCGFSYQGLGRRHIRALGHDEPVDLFRLSREQWQRRQRAH